MFLIDNNLSPKLAVSLQKTYPGIMHVVDVDLDESTDNEIWEYASTNGLNILTKDADFNDILGLRKISSKGSLDSKWKCLNKLYNFIT